MTSEPDRPCDVHPPPSTLASVGCNRCGAFKMHGGPLVYCAVPSTLPPNERELTFHLVRIFDQGRALLARGDEFEIDLALRLLRTLDLPGFGPPDPLSLQGGCFACGKPHIYELLAPPVRGGISARRRSYWMCQEHLDSMKPKRPYHAPALTELGTVGDLTRGVGGHSVDGTFGNTKPTGM